MALIFEFFYLDSHNKKNFFLISMLALIGLSISSIPSFLSILGEPTNRVIMNKPSLLSAIINELSNLGNNFMINDFIKLFFLPMNMVKLFILGSIIYYKNEQIRFFLLFSYFLLIF